jgi:hypothetical protein
MPVVGQAPVDADNRGRQRDREDQRQSVALGAQAV